MFLIPCCIGIARGIVHLVLQKHPWTSIVRLRGLDHLVLCTRCRSWPTLHWWARRLYHPVLALYSPISRDSWWRGELTPSTICDHHEHLIVQPGYCFCKLYFASSIPCPRALVLTLPPLLVMISKWKVLSFSRAIVVRFLWVVCFSVSNMWHEDGDS